LAARDDYGLAYPVPWGQVNLRTCIQQGDYGHRGEQGLFEAVGFRLFLEIIALGYTAAA
jgi:hypothetical protein